MENNNDDDDVNVEQYEFYMGDDLGVVLETEVQLSQHQKWIFYYYFFENLDQYLGGAERKKLILEEGNVFNNDLP